MTSTTLENVRLGAEQVREIDGVDVELVAQEVHDVVGHGLTAIKMQADVALHVMSKKPDQAASALQAISRASGDALEELRATLTVGRFDRETAGSPITQLAHLEGLRRQLSHAGVQLDIETIGTPRPLPAAVDLTGYRIVQESLTNVLKHSNAAVATVGIEYEPDAVTITVTNPAIQVDPTIQVSVSNGLGVPGMRSRVTSLGGSFTAGLSGDGHFTVRATIPTGGHQ